MNIRIIAVGKLKEKYWRDAVAEYTKRLGAYCSIDITEIKESQLRANPSAADEEAVTLLTNDYAHINGKADIPRVKKKCKALKLIGHPTVTKAKKGDILIKHNCPMEDCPVRRRIGVKALLLYGSLYCYRFQRCIKSIFN